jgi:urease accessory protein
MATLIIQKKLGNIRGVLAAGKKVDNVLIEWYELSKRILHKQSVSGRALALRFLAEDPGFRDGDILYEDENSLIVIEVPAVDAIVLRPVTMRQMAALCYEIGNKHLPLFLEGEELLVPYDTPLFRLFESSCYSPERQLRKLEQAVKTSVAPHGNSSSLFSRIMQMTSASNG